MSMMRESLGILSDKIGLGDIVLPFLLVFSIVFAILEKTKVFGVETIDNKKYTRKNLNAMTAFVVAFFVVMSNKLVQVITKTTSNFVLLLLITILFLMLVGALRKESDEGIELTGAWKGVFEAIIFLGLAVIFLSSIKTDSGETWLSYIWNLIGNSLNSQIWAGILLIILLGGSIFFITKSPSPPTNNSGSNSGS